MFISLMILPVKYFCTNWKYKLLQFIVEMIILNIMETAGFCNQACFVLVCETDF